MSEVSFAKSFLASLDKRAIKLPADHVSDAKKYPAQSPFTLPRQTHPFPRKGATSTASQQAKQKTVTATLKPMRGSGETITVADLTLTSTIHDVKTSYAQQSGQPQDKIKLLLNKKPAADLKTLQELGVEGGTVELSVMIMGGGGSAATTPAVEKSEPVMSAPLGGDDKMDVDSSQTPAPASEKAQAEADGKADAQGGTVAEMLKGEEFWADLKGFLAQRLRDEGEVEKLAKVFREAFGKL
ncbi:hypothetical protein LTR35_004869 [Friedmanniomyces endolithicus]|uniref:Ubiquitin-like domain-containing protein n=1 Tax=Friedmanniomyces endolithicus TaxID=329885 RepID=A0AAN6J3X0_9PEZI|nr:hypothetical protein LTR35_004869 [Friedmanniomyces endolithicus]KAK0296679.1 hypothetical protein LTS00_005005 [Friedmanniomyces endolithicus]KAK0302415.1 hypothetical protein LTR82_017875 [Friedmanniomyces endolithicus]KAK1003786.1 hypothetical protein LTR54_007549 [Friedmanniomyces endolithicus]